MADLMEYVNVLADQIGPRPVSTEEEHQASLYIAQELTDRGLDVNVDEFATPTGVRWPYALAFALSSLGTFISGIGIFVPGISLSMFIIGLILVIAGLFIYYTEWNNQPFLSKVRTGGVSQNVVAKYVPSSVARESRRRKVIICAHVDTVRVRPEDGPRFIGHAPLLRKIIFYCMIGLVALMFIRLLPIPWPEAIDTVLWVISLLGCVYVLAAAACIVASNFTPFISGGNDNASSIAVLLSVARLLLDPKERERYMVERPVMQNLDIPVETFATDATGPIDLELDELDEPIMHSAQEAEAAGLVPEGVEVVYDDDYERQDATVVFPSLSPEEQLGVLADTAAEELHMESVTTGAFSLDDLSVQPEARAGIDALPEIKVPELDFNLDEDASETTAGPVERLDDSVIFAEYMASEREEEAAREVEQDEERILEVEAIDAEVQAEVEVEEEQPAPAPVYVPIEPEIPPRSNRRQVARPVPSWYAAAKEKAAKDLERRAEQGQAAEEQPVLSYRSRFADTPVSTPKSREREEELVEERLEELEAQYVDELHEEQALEVEDAIEAAEAVVEDEELVDEVEVTLVAEEEEEVVDLDIPDDQLDELSPDASGLFPTIEVSAEEVVTKKPEGAPKQLTSRIPNIGSSDDKVREERKSAAEERAARGSRTELQDIPSVADNADFGEMVVETIEAAEPVEPVRPAFRPAPSSAAPKVNAPKAPRKKPTARHVSESFTPTRAVDADRPLGDNRQEAPVSSVYEDTPQNAPLNDPFEPKDGYGSSYRPSSFARAERMSSSQSSYTEEVVASPGNSASFPALTGSFPALSGSMPVVDVGEFTETRSVVAGDEALDNFMAAGQTTEINIPESRFRSAFDKVGGLFSRKNKNEDVSVDSQGWDDDDYGWKGGGYFQEEAEQAYDAVRERAAQIRESVISMTESDLLDKEVWFVALGASGAGSQGMKNFLDLHSSELRGSLIINLEAVGAGTLCYIDSEGTGKSRRADRRLMSLVKKASKELKGHEMKPKSMDWRNTDATPAMTAGMRALTLMGIADNGVAPVNWHCADDTADIVEEDNLEYMARLLLKVIENS